MNERLFAQLILIFLATQFLGLSAGNNLIVEEVSAPIVTENPEDVENSFGLFGYIIGFTIVLLILIKFAPEWVVYWIMKLFESFAIFFASIIVFWAFSDSGLIFVLAFVLVIVRNIWKENLWLRNLTSVLATAGAGALIGVSLGVIPVLVFLVLLSVYDFIAVFKTKHMVKLAKAITKKNLSFTYALPTPEHTFELGTGDIVIPLTFAVSLLAEFKPVYEFPFYWIPSGLILLASLSGLLYTMNYSSKNIGKALPALPLQAICMIVMYGAMVLVGI